MINVNEVYRTVLLILNKEQRGFMTPDEFNNIADITQKEMVNNYFEDLNKFARVQQIDEEYGDRYLFTEQKLEPFQYIDTINLPISNNIINLNSLTNEVYRLGVVTYTSDAIYPRESIEVKKVSAKELQKSLASKLTTPTLQYPVYGAAATAPNSSPGLGTPQSISIYPLSAIESTGVLTINYISVIPPVWGYNIGSQGQYEYNSGTSINFMLIPSEKTDLIIKILLYAGVIIRDPQIIQVAMQEEQKNELIEKQ